MINLDPRTTALVLIDLQKPIVGMPLSPYSGPEVVSVCTGLAGNFRKAGARVVLVNVAFAKDFGDALRAPVDEPFSHPPGGLPEDWAELVDGLSEPTDLRVTKHQWGAFYGTDLDVQLRRRGIKSVVLGGIATNFGVESTAEQAWERGYEVISRKTQRPVEPPRCTPFPSSRSSRVSAGLPTPRTSGSTLNGAPDYRLP